MPREYTRRKPTKYQALLEEIAAMREADLLRWNMEPGWGEHTVRQTISRRFGETVWTKFHKGQVWVVRIEP